MSFGAIQAVVLHLEGHAFRIEADQSAVGNRDAVGVARQVGQHRFGPGEGFLGIHNPVDLAQRLQESTKDGGIGKLGMVAEELQLPGFVQLGQPFQNEPPVQAGQHPDGQEEVLAAGDPLGAIGRQSTTRHDHVHMRVMRHCRSPGVQHRRDADLRTKVLGVGGYLDHCVRARPHQQVVNLAFVLVGDVGDLVWAA